MKRLLFLVLAVCLISTAAPADTKPPSKALPLVIAFAAPVGEQQTPSDSEIVATVIARAKASGLMDILAFNPDLPIVARAMMEKRLDQETISQTGDPKKAARVASALGAQYALEIQGSVAGSKVSVSLQIIEASSGENWSATSESEIAQVGGRADTNRSNAILTASSSATSQVLIGAFGQSAVLNGGEPSRPNPDDPRNTPGTATPSDPASPTTPMTPAAPKKTEPPRDLEAEYSQLARQIEASHTNNDLPNLVTALRRAINLKPDEPTLRIQLAQAYSDMGMVAEAVDECRRALLFNRDSMPIHQMLAKLYTANDAPDEAIAQYREIARIDAANVDVRLTLGDMLWNQGKIDDAASLYEEAAKLGPDRPEPQERLQRLYTARKMYTEMIEHMLQARLLAAGDGTTDAARYEAIAQLTQDEFRTVMGKLQAAGMDFANQKTTREDYYRESKDASGRIDALAGFLSTQVAPEALKEIHSHGVLAVNLLAQVAGYTVSYLETEKQHYADQAELLKAEARTEMDLFAGGLRKT